MYFCLFQILFKKTANNEFKSHLGDPQVQFSTRLNPLKQSWILNIWMCYCCFIVAFGVGDSSLWLGIALTPGCAKYPSSLAAPDSLSRSDSSRILRGALLDSFGKCSVLENKMFSGADHGIGALCWLFLSSLHVQVTQDPTICDHSLQHSLPDGLHFRFVI